MSENFYKHIDMSKKYWGNSNRFGEDITSLEHINKYKNKFREMLNEILSNSELDTLSVEDIPYFLIVDLCDILKNNKKITSLSIDVAEPRLLYKEGYFFPKYESEFMDIESANAIAELINTNNTINEISISRSRLGASATPIINALITNKSIKEISLTSNKIGDDVAPKIIELINNNKNLNRLILSHNKFSDESRIAIASATLNNVDCSLAVWQYPVTRADYTIDDIDKKREEKLQKKLDAMGWVPPFRIPE